MVSNYKYISVFSNINILDITNRLCWINNLTCQIRITIVPVLIYIFIYIYFLIDMINIIKYIQFSIFDFKFYNYGNFIKMHYFKIIFWIFFINIKDT